MNVLGNAFGLHPMFSFEFFAYVNIDIADSFGATLQGNSNMFDDFPCNPIQAMLKV